MIWEDAVRWYRAQPGNEAAVRANYFDLPVLQAAERYATSEEFAEVAHLLGPGAGRAILDLGAGNGIASYALARAGWRVTALEPDPSAEVGAGAICEIQTSTNLPIEIVMMVGERLPFPDTSFDAVFARQVLHHVPDLPQTMREAHRILRPGGTVLALREHVASDAAELAAFLERHPLQHLYGGENAHPLETYLDTAKAAGFRVAGAWGRLESILNFHPGAEAERRAVARNLAAGRWFGLGRIFLHAPGFIPAALARHSAEDRLPGRIHSFLFRKP